MGRGIALKDKATIPAQAGDSGNLQSAELADLREQLREARETLDAIRTGAVDALVLGSPGEERVFALAGADRPYRLLVEAMNEGAATISSNGVVLYANARLGELAGRAVNAVIATPAVELVAEADRPAFARLLAVKVGEHAEGEFQLAGRGDIRVGVLLSVVGLDLDGTLVHSLVATDLTERKRSEAFLRTALDAMLEGTSISSAIRGSDGRIIDFRIDYANPAIAAIRGRSVADQRGRPLLELFPELRAGELFDALVRVVETGGSVEFDGYCHGARPPDRPIDQYLDIRAAKLGDGYVMSVRDVTERRAAAARLKESEYFFRESQRAASIGSYRATFSEDRWESSETLDAIFGIDAAYQRTVSGWLDLVHPDDRADMERHLQLDVIEGRQEFAKEYRIVRPSDGATRWVAGLGAVGVDPDGRVVNLAGTVQDVTARRAAEAEMRRLSMAIEHSADSVVITSTTWEIEYVNPAFERISGYTRDEVLGQNPRILDSGIHGKAYWTNLLATVADGATFTGDITNRCKDGSLYQVESVISPIRQAGEEITGYVNVSRDVTRERRREAALTRLASERELIAAALAEVRVGSTPEATGQAVCEQILRMAGVAGAALYYFGHDGRAVPLAFIRQDGTAAAARTLPVARARVLRDRALSGPWAEKWIKRPWHPSNKMFTELGITALAFAPIMEQGSVIGLLQIATAAPDGEMALTGLLPGLLEFAGLASALVGPSIADLTEHTAVRGRIKSIMQYGAFRTVYQPVVEVSTGAHLGYEALTRFTDGSAPDEVFAAARTVDLGTELELATLAKAIDSAAALPSRAWLSLNVSPHLVMAGPDLARLLRRAHRPIVLEITEHAPIDDYVALVDTVRRIRPKVRIAVDDAGAGVANFNHIVELGSAFVKLDIGLIRGIDTDLARQALVLGLLHFAKEAETSAIAEGVETAEELAMLEKLGVKLVQGYLVGRPAPVESWTKVA